MAKKKKEVANPSREKIILIAVAVVMAPILFVIIQNVSHSISIARKIGGLNREAKLYQSQIDRDSLLLEEIKFDEGLEKYARESYFMQRSGERVFIIEK